MTTADRGNLDARVCPFCGKVGGLTWDYASRSVRCSFCYVSGIEEDDISARSKATKNKGESAPTSAKPEKGKHIVDETQTVDAIRDERGNPVYIVYHHKLDPSPPDLYLSLRQCQFHRWRLQDQIRNEARYGRDDLRKRGFKVTEKVRHQGRLIKMMEQEKDE